jgi:2-oxoglutarate ferredoxin oxidoreductase subunit alpha
VAEFMAAHPHCYVVEQNRDGQLRSLLLIETGFGGERLRPVLSYGGLPITASFIRDRILEQESPQ